jgi:hypothetical protein
MKNQLQRDHNTGAISANNYENEIKPIANFSTVNIMLQYHKHFHRLRIFGQFINSSKGQAKHHQEPFSI